MSIEELEKFKWLLQSTYFQRSLPHISWRQLQWIDRVDILVDLMVEMCGQQSVEVTKEVFMEMNRTDLVQRLSETSSGHKGKRKKTTVTFSYDDKSICIITKLYCRAKY